MEERKIDFAVGGQAVIEGVMIRSPSYVTIAVRNPKGEIIVKKDRFKSLSEKIKILKLPIVRGIVNLFEMLVVGMKALDFSTKIAFEESIEKPDGKFKQFLNVAAFIVSIIISLAFALFLFKFVPLFITTQLQKIFPAIKNSVWLFNFIDGLLRMGIFFLYIIILARIKYFRRVFEYHGAEHKTVFTHEKGHPLTFEYIKNESPRHPRCGTSFIILILVVSILIFSLVPRHPDFLLNFLRRVAILPLIAGIGYEVLKWTAKNQKKAFVKFLTYPGIFTQYITAKEPDEKQIEVAAAALKTAVELEQQKTFV